MLQHFTLTCLAALITSLLFSSPVFSNISAFQTTRLKSTAGAGAGAILMEESTILNPAPLAFYQASSLYYQRSSIASEPVASDRPFTSSESQTDAFIVTDAKGGASGSISYIKQARDNETRDTLALSIANTIGEKSAMGVTYKFVTEESSLDQSKEKYRQATFGISHVINSSFSLGLVAIDPFKVRPEETRGLVGGQYVFENFISLMLDVGADYNKELTETQILRAATQIKIYDDFFLRFGGFSDEGLGEKGTGIGLGWIQPKLVIEVAMQNTTTEENLELERAAEKDKETSFSLAYRF